MLGLQLRDQAVEVAFPLRLHQQPTGSGCPTEEVVFKLLMPCGKVVGLLLFLAGSLGAVSMR